LFGKTKVAELARQGIEAFVKAQKEFLDAIAEQVTVATEPAREVRKQAEDRAKILARLANEGVEKYMEAQKKLVDLAVEQVETAGNGGASAKRPQRTTLAKLTQKSVQNFVSAQKSLLDIAVKPVKAETQAAHPKKAAKTRKRAGAARAKVPETA
jgi:predicted RNase H-like nuclease (RuvC/YqgF family)